MAVKRIVKYTVLLGCAMVAGPARALDIVGLQGNGSLTWTNSDTNLFYQIQWSASLGGSNVWMSGYTNLADIRSTSSTVRVSVPMFYRISAASNRVQHTSPVPRTGQTSALPLNPAPTNSDGALQKGAAWPYPRFTDNGDGTVEDNQTGLIWLKNANAFGGQTWATALTDCSTLNSGEAGLSDGSVEGDWRLPSVRELLSLIDYGRYGPAVCNTLGTGPWAEGDPFTAVQSQYYWTSSTYGPVPTAAFSVVLNDGKVYSGDKTASVCVWPVRDAR